MKIFTLILALFLVNSCGPTSQNDSSKEGSEAETSNLTHDMNEAIQWVRYSETNSNRKNKKIVLISGDEEYRSEEALPQLAKILTTHHGYDCTVLFAQDPLKPGIVNPTCVQNIPGLQALEDADLMILFTRFRDLPDAQMQYFENYLKKGKPIIGIRTSTHAFKIDDMSKKWSHWGNYYNGDLEEWHGGFGQSVLGAPWYSHHGGHKYQSTRGKLAENLGDHPLMHSIKSEKVWGATDVYGHKLPLPESVKTLMLGQVINAKQEFDEKDLFFGMRETDDEVALTNPRSDKKYNPNDPLMPIIWEKPYQIEGGQNGMTITSTIGASVDLTNEELRRFFVNACYYLLDLSIPANSKVELVGEYNPTQFEFRSKEYWNDRNMKVSDYK